ncbi:MAG: YqeG family HAD IIIA-type phosphatase [Clostridia bacterium]|nr:YqeG family HAD IIIA-type phosphatase [Clostridia bacterium]MBP3360234.1 YqeG family HAD IIIA-type phosphatase [Clostridia bacterium]
MFKRFYPDYKFNSVRDIDEDFFRKNNIKFALLDIDNTLVSYTVPKADEAAKGFLEMLDNAGIEYAFVSNNHKERVERFAKEFGAIYVHDAAKPLLFGIKRAMRALGAKRENTVLIGDQVFTDVYAGKRAGLLTVMVDPIEAKETPFFEIKRKLEKFVLKDYKG